MSSSESLLVLPDSLIGDICDWAGGVAISQLFCCGNKTLNFRLSSQYGVTLVHLSEESMRFLDKLPTFLGLLKGLREVNIEIRGNRRVPHLTLGWLKSLPKSVLKLSLHCKEAETCWLDDTQASKWYFSEKTKERAVVSSCTAISPIFPQLRHLELIPTGNLSHWRDFHPDFILKSFPRSLRVLKLPHATNWCVNHWLHLPVGLEEVEIGIQRLEKAKLARLHNLTILDLPRLELLTNEDLSCLPPVLTSFKIPSVSFRDDDINLDASLLPRNLELLKVAAMQGEQFSKWAKGPPIAQKSTQSRRLDLKDTSKDLSLKSLSCVSLHSCQMHYLPESIKNLDFVAYPPLEGEDEAEVVKVVQNLPPRLTRLSWGRFVTLPPVALAALPKTLTSIFLEVFHERYTVEEQVTALPSSLTFLSVQYGDPTNVHTDIDVWIYEVHPAVKKVRFKSEVWYPWYDVQADSVIWYTIYTAFESGNKRLIEHLKCIGAVEEHFKHTGYSSLPLTAAVRTGSIDNVKWVFEAGIWDSSDMMGPLTEAASLGNLDMIKYLYHAIGEPAFLPSEEFSGIDMAMIATQRGRINVLQWLKTQQVAFNLNPRSETNLPLVACIHNQLATFLWLCHNEPVKITLSSLVTSLQTDSKIITEDPFPALTTLSEGGFSVTGVAKMTLYLAFPVFAYHTNALRLLMWLKRFGPPNFLLDLGRAPNTYSIVQVVSGVPRTTNTALIPRFVALVEWVLLNTDSDFNAPGPDGQKPLKNFANNQQIEVLAMLKSHGIT